MENAKNSHHNFILSIIVPIYKAEAYVKQCIDSLVSQNSQSVEIILVDDGSPDSCPDICDEYAAKNNNIKVIHKSNGGAVSARKVGFAASCGKYVTFVDSDDWVAGDYYEKIIRILIEFRPEIYSATSFFKAEDDKIKRIVVEKHSGLYDRYALESQVFKSLLCNIALPFDFCFTPSLWSKVIRRDVIAQFLQDEPECICLGEDLAVTLPCMLNANTVYFGEMCGYYYRQTPNSITHTFDATLPRKMDVLLCFLKEKTADYKAYGMETQLALYGINMLKNILVLLVNKSDDYCRDLKAFKPLFKNELIKQAPSTVLSFKDKIFITVAKLRATVLLRVFKKRCKTIERN